MTGTQQQQRSIHPGAGRRGGRNTPKGRQVEPAALAEVQALLGDRPRQRDLLIEHLHLLQDEYHCLHARHLAALAEEMNLALVEVYEVASFYAHFDIVLEGEAPPPPLTVRVCDSLTCELMGARKLLAALPQNVAKAVKNGHAAHAPLPAYRDFAAYRADGGYKLLEACLAGKVPLEDILKKLEDSQIKGLGGAGFPTGRKWRFVRAEPKPRLMAVNADEGEPGTFKDRVYLETDPH